MENIFVKAAFDIHCRPLKGTVPVYRIYVDGELFTERKWVWNKNEYLTQILQIEAPPGEYEIEFESWDTELSTYNYKILVGDNTSWIDKNRLLIG